MNTVKETAKLFRVSSVAVRNWIKDGLPHEKEKVVGIKTRIVIDYKDVIEYHKAKEKR